MNKPRIEIEYCRQCGFLPRAAWMAQELLGAFSEELGELALVPGGMGAFVVRLEGEEIFSKKALGRYPEPKELKEAIAARIAPDRHFGHKR